MNSAFFLLQTIIELYTVNLTGDLTNCAYCYGLFVIRESASSSTDSLL